MEELLINIGNQVGKLTVMAIRIAFKLQGHSLTGNLEKSIRYEVEVSQFSGTVRIFMANYGLAQEFGVPANNIPFSRTGRGGKSKYIEGLKYFAKKRFFASEKEATSIAFAIASKHKKEGMPTRSSIKFSRTGKRTGAIKSALDDTQAERDRIISEALQRSIISTIRQFTNTA